MSGPQVTAQGADPLDMPRTRLRPPGAEEPGFALVEVLAAVVVLAVLALAAFSGLSASVRASEDSRARVTAAALAAQELEAYDAVANVPEIEIGSFTRPETVGPRTYEVRTTAAWLPAQAAPANRCAGASTGGRPYVKVSVDVRWPGARSPVRSETLLTPRAGTGPAATASQRVHVIDRNGTSRQGQQVLLIGAGTTTALPTDEFGCVVFADLPDGNYEVRLDTPGHVGVRGTQVDSRMVTVSSAGTPRLVEVLYDRAAAVDVSFAPVTGFTAVPGLAATVVNSGLQPTGQRTQPAASATSTTTAVTSLFPFPSGYQGWLGSCAGADPGAYPGGARAVAPVPPGGSSALITPGGQVTVLTQTQANNGNRTPAGGVAVKASRPGCGESFTFTTGADGYARVLLPFGPWDLAPVTRTVRSSENASYTVTPTSRNLTRIVVQ